MNEPAYIGFLLLSGLAAGHCILRLRLPMVTGYLLVGLLIGPSITGIVSESMLSQLGPVEDLALGFIAFTIGMEFHRSIIRETGRQILTITTVQLASTAVFVTLAVAIVSKSWSLALILGTIATATAPGETMMVIKELRASGPLSRSTLGVVALDDLLGIFLFALILPVATFLEQGTGLSLQHIAIEPIREIAGSILLGGITGTLLSMCWRRAPSHGWGLTLFASFVIAGIAGAHHWHLSPLLTNMAMGAVVVNTNARAHHILRDQDEVFNLILVVFFTVAGASLRLSALPLAGAVGLAYLLSRTIGKFFGANVGSRLAHASPAVQRFLGLTLLPQAGVALGLVVIASARLPQFTTLLTTVVLTSTLVFSLVGAPLAYYAITQAGESTIASHSRRRPMTKGVRKESSHES